MSKFFTGVYILFSFLSLQSASGEIQKNPHVDILVRAQLWEDGIIVKRSEKKKKSSSRGQIRHYNTDKNMEEELFIPLNML